MIEKDIREFKSITPNGGLPEKTCIQLLNRVQNKRIPLVIRCLGFESAKKLGITFRSVSRHFKTKFRVEVFREGTVVITFPLLPFEIEEGMRCLWEYLALGNRIDFSEMKNGDWALSYGNRSKIETDLRPLNIVLHCNVRIFKAIYESLTIYVGSPFRMDEGLFTYLFEPDEDFRHRKCIYTDHGYHILWPKNSIPYFRQKVGQICHEHGVYG